MSSKSKEILSALLLAAACLVLLASCGKDGGGEEARYYVKYTGETSTVHIVETTYTVATDTGTDSYKTTGASSDYSVTIGPVKKGFQASISCRIVGESDYGVKSQRVTIEASRGGEPFAQKAAGTSQASYTIDY
ncbi:MAG: hypothetical protein IKW89_00045 [Bacteroidales bacterium]|nr:hypothetical protein [Bacteroidales bacterium]